MKLQKWHVFLSVPLVFTAVVCAVVGLRDDLFSVAHVDSGVYEQSTTDIVTLQKQWQQIAYEQRREASLQRRWIMTFGAIIAVSNLINWTWALCESLSITEHPNGSTCKADVSRAAYQVCI